MIAPGGRIGDYEVERLLGEGGFASVWLVRHAVLRSRHALKVLDAELAAIPGLRERFVAEGRILAQLRHPNLVAVTGLVQQGDRVGLVMDFVEGGDLATRLAGGALPREDALAIVAAIADGMHHAHEAGIVHRDLKPENVLVVASPQGPRPIVVDFGIAKVLADTAVETPRAEPTRLSVRMGTPRYMSPEQVEAAAAVDRRSDVFALGVILYEALLGRHAFDGATDTEVMYHVVRGEYRPPDELDPPLRALVVRAMALSPDDRFPTCRALREAIEALPAPDVAAPPVPPLSPSSSSPTLAPHTAEVAPPVDDVEAAAPPPSPPAPTGMAVRPLLAVSGALLVGAALLAAASWSTLPVPRAPAPPTPIVRSPPAPMATMPQVPASPAPAAPASSEVVAPASPEVVAPAPHATPHPAPRPVPHPVAPRPPTDERIVDAAWSRHRDALSTCPGKPGDIVKITVDIGPGGRPRHVAADAASHATDLERCAEATFRALDFGPTAGDLRRTFTVRR